MVAGNNEDGRSEARSPSGFVHSDQLEEVWENLVELGVPSAATVLHDIVSEQLRMIMEVALVQAQKEEDAVRAHEELRHASGETRMQEIDRQFEEARKTNEDQFEAELNNIRNDTMCDILTQVQRELQLLDSDLQRCEALTSRWKLQYEEEVERLRREANGEIAEEPARKRQRLCREIDAEQRRVLRSYEKIERTYQELEGMQDEDP
jgi:myosin heavy subunit